MGLKLENISKRFNDKVIFTNLNITFNSCGLYLIEGRSGSGKSTLLNIIAGFDKEDSGTYYINDKEIVANKRNDLSNYISYVMQENNVLNGFTVLENLLLVTNDKQKILEYLRYVGLESLIDTKANLLSGGEKLRLNIARELIKDTSVLLLDEPTSSLDLESAKKVMEILEKIAKEKLVIIASHDLELMKEYNIKTIQIAKEVNFNDIDNEMVLNKEINLSLPFKLISKFFLVNFKKGLVKNIFSLFIIVLMLALVSSFISLYCTSNKDILINFYKANSLETVKFDMNSNDGLNAFINGNKYLMYKSFTTILDKNEINVYISDEDFNGVKISSALNDFYHNSYKINDMIEISYQNRTYEFKISEIIAEEYNNEIDFIVDSNYIIVSEKVLDVEPIFVVVRGDVKEILTLAYQCQLNVQINQSTINLEVGPYKTDLYKAFIIVGSIFGLGFSMLFFLNFIINQKDNISFLYLTNFKKKTIYKIYSFILLIYSLLIVVFGVSFSYIINVIFNYYVMNKEGYSFLPYSFNNLSFVSLIILLVIYGFVYYLKLYNYLKKAKIDFIKDNI